jgi:hypothetical protein
MVANGSLPQKGFIRQEHIPFDAFTKTKWGRLYIQEQTEKQMVV